MSSLTIAEQLERFQGYFPGPHLELVCASIRAGNTAGQLWVFPEEDAPVLLLLWDKGNNVFYLAGDCPTPAALAWLTDVVSSDLRPQAGAAGRPYFKVGALSPSLEQELPTIFSGVVLHEYPVLFFVDDALTPLVAIPPPMVPTIDIVPITHAILTSGLAQSAEVRAEIRWMWPTEDQFFTHGFGTLAIVDNAIICWCTAEYVSSRRCGIGITTLAPYERRGVATTTAASFVREARRRGLVACWECGRANHGSRRVAEKIGFTLRAEEAYWVGSFAP